MKKWKQFIKDMALRNKMIAVCLLVSLIPTIALGLFSAYQMNQALHRQRENAHQEILCQEADHINYKLESYLYILNHIAANNAVENALTRDYETSIQMYLAYRDTIDPQLETVRVLLKELNSIGFYSNAGIYMHGSILRPLKEGEECIWYDKTLNSYQPQFTFSENQKKLYVTRRVYISSAQYINLLVMDIDVEKTFGSIAAMYDEAYAFVILDSEGNSIYEYEHQMDLLKEKDKTDLEKSCTVQEYPIESARWTAVLYMPDLSVDSEVFNIAKTVLVLIVFSTALGFFLSSNLARIIVRPVNALVENMQQVQRGKYELTVENTQKDEIGQLIGAFKSMVERLNYLVNEVLRAKIAKQKYELRILQAQINPHFLYNALSLISSKAILSGQDEISRLAQLLSTFYRTMLNRGRQTVTIAEELNNVRSYVEIQQIMHSDSFEAVYEIEEGLLEYMIPNMLLQPLAENAILHGLDYKESPGKGILTISAYEDEDDIVFKVMDNGSGMTPEQCESILHAESRGYGVKNVNQRIQLYYGETYGITYHSVLGRGSYALMRIKKVMTPDEEEQQSEPQENRKKGNES